jgi:hypothetical protein
MARTTTRMPHGGQFLTVGYEGRTLDEFMQLPRRAL